MTGLACDSNRSTSGNLMNSKVSKATIDCSSRVTLLGMSYQNPSFDVETERAPVFTTILVLETDHRSQNSP